MKTRSDPFQDSHDKIQDEDGYDNSRAISVEKQSIDKKPTTTRSLDVQLKLEKIDLIKHSSSLNVKNHMTDTSSNETLLKET
jgi:hypothetical protein